MDARQTKLNEIRTRRDALARVLAQNGDQVTKNFFNTEDHKILTEMHDEFDADLDSGIVSIPAYPNL